MILNRFIRDNNIVKVISEIGLVMAEFTTRWNIAGAQFNPSGISVDLELPDVVSIPNRFLRSDPPRFVDRHSQDQCWRHIDIPAFDPKWRVLTE